jgi:sulfur-oxidizing protein SoxY
MSAHARSWWLPALVLLLASGAARSNQSEISTWDMLLRPKYFDGIALIESEPLIELVAPYRAEDAALTPITISAKIPQTELRYIERIWLFVDRNPQPLAGVFRLTPAMGRADLGMRIRIDQYTHVRAIAKLNSGEHYMASAFVKAQGGCSAPLGSDLDAAMERIGRMRFRTVGAIADDHTITGQLNVSHPNITGLQLDQRTRVIRPEHYVKSVRVSLNDELLMEAETGFSLSEDPSFRFFFRPGRGGVLKAEVVDSKGLSFTEQFEVEI